MNYERDPADLMYSKQREYISHFKSWNFAKNQPNETWKHVGLAVEKRKQDNKDSIAIVDGLIVPPKRLKHETSRHFYTQIEKATNRMFVHHMLPFSNVP